MAKKEHQTEEFKALQKEWYDKLRVTGFQDAERNGKLKQRAENAYWGATEDIREAKAAYYSAINECLAMEEFSSPLHERIMNLHADGKLNNEIVRDLTANGPEPRRRNTVATIIAQYVDKWGVRHMEVWSKDVNWKRKATRDG